MTSIISAIVETGLSLMDIRIDLRNSERHLGILDAGVEDEHSYESSLLLSWCSYRKNPRVG